MSKRDWGNGVATGLVIGGGITIFILVWWYGVYCGPGYPCSYHHDDESYKGSIWYDSAAQWLAAVTGLFVAIFTFVTILLVRKAVATDNAALDQAKLQTVEAGKSTLAALRSVDIAGEMGRAQTRAYVSAAWAVAEDRGIYSLVGVNFINTGQTPALWINIQARHHTFDNVGPRLGLALYDDEIGIDYGPLEAAGNIILPPCGKGIEDGILKVKEASGNVTIRIFGRIQYETVFREIYETEFAFETNVISMEFAEEPIKMKRTAKRLRTYRLINPDTQAK